MKKVIVLVLGGVLAGCQATPERQATDAPAAQPAPATASLTSAQEIQAAAQEAPVAEAPAAPAPEQTPAEPAEPVQQTTQAVAQVEAPVAAPAPKPAAASATAPVSQRAMGMDSRMDKVVKLINSSSGARQVMASDNPEAHQHHARAKALYNEALNATDKSEASRLLNEAVKAMYSAIRAASPASVLAEKKKRDYQKLHRSVNTFLEQHQRISDEKQAGAEGEALRGQVNLLVAEADAKYEKGQYDEAQQLLRESFEMLRNSIEGMRGGDTLVRTLNFATKADEYNYELERYKSQRLLVDVLLKEKRKSSPYVAQQVDKYIALAEEGREQAERAAAGGDHEAGIKYLEDARKYIVRALRTGGIYVPG
ncbi:hypothetical protein [Motiliproteus sp. SC1-56]|uniref:hypothetical protein n=1 Tax=Motiliproteus sp. SC1-56 TaxID=2799565 RepID=UPI001A8DF32E|nr:hypothetical protein [Motiliproteus sp. SC1-56]